MVYMWHESGLSENPINSDLKIQNVVFFMSKIYKL